MYTQHHKIHFHRNHLNARQNGVKLDVNFATIKLKQFLVVEKAILFFTKIRFVFLTLAMQVYKNSIGEKVFFNVNIQPLILSFDEKITIAPMILFMDFVFDYFHY